MPALYLGRATPCAFNGSAIETPVHDDLAAHRTSGATLGGDRLARFRGPTDTEAARATVALAGEFYELTPDRPTLSNRFSREQLTDDTPVVCRSPLDAPAIGVRQARHHAKHGPALIQHPLLDLGGIRRNCCRDPRHNFRQHSRGGVGLQRADHPSKIPLTPHPEPAHLRAAAVTRS